MKIVIISEYLPPYISGIANRVKNLVNAYKTLGNKVKVYSLKNTNADVHIYSLPNPLYNHQRLFLLPPFSLLLDLLNPFRTFDWDIVHVFGPMAVPIIPLLPLFRGVKVYVSYHVYLEYYKELYFGKNYFLGLVLEFLFVWIYFIPFVMFANMVGVPSKTADYCVFKYCKNIHYMKSGLDATIFHPIEEEEKEHETPITDVILPKTPILTYVGRLAVEKNIPFLITSLTSPLIPPNTSLLIIGDGPERHNLELLSFTLFGKDKVYSPDQTQTVVNVITHIKHFQPRIIFCGMIADEKKVAEYYARSNLFVSASASETFGFTVAEAMATGTPSIVVNKGAFSLVYNMISDWMFEEEDVEGFCRRVEEVLLQGRKARVRARRVAVDGFTVEAAVLDMLGCYRRVIDGDDNGGGGREEIKRLLE